MQMLNEGEKKSSTRIAMFFCLFVAAWLSHVSMQGGVTYEETTLIGAWLISGIGGKQVGKFFETRNNHA